MGSGSIEGDEAGFAKAMSYSDDEAIPAEGFDPTERGGWAWWAKKILDAADGN